VEQRESSYRSLSRGGTRGRVKNPLPTNRNPGSIKEAACACLRSRERQQDAPSGKGTGVRQYSSFHLVLSEGFIGTKGGPFSRDGWTPSASTLVGAGNQVKNRSPLGGTTHPAKLKGAGNATPGDPPALGHLSETTFNWENHSKNNLKNSRHQEPIDSSH